MLSICIPVYNFNITELFKVLHRQATDLKIEFEIIVVDDNSREDLKGENSEIKEFSNTTYIELDQNIGRSKIRNLLAEKARYDYIIFMDCDSRVISENYISDYVNNCEGELVIFGGREYDKQLQDDQYRLRWFYGLKRETTKAEIRMLHPYNSFMTNNFMISKSIFQRIKFDERLSKYGHEDTLFGYELKKHNIPIKHIDNPLVHIGLESNEEFLGKTEEGLVNLLNIIKYINSDEEFINSVKLLSVYEKLVRLKLRKLISIFFKVFRPLLHRNLMSTKPSLLIFDLYKIGYLSHQENI